MDIIKRINTIEEIEQCPILPINQYEWTGKVKPNAYARIGFLYGYGLIVKMTAEEREPLRRYRVDNEPVYQDSAMEIFLNFKPDEKEQKYVNFEMNSFGTMLCEYGSNKKRNWLCDLTKNKAHCKATIGETEWSVLLQVPSDLIREFHDGKELEAGDVISFNCYKISEDPSIEHYGSYAPIEHPVPSFHQPQFFAKAVIE